MTSWLGKIRDLGKYEEMNCLIPSGQRHAPEHQTLSNWSDSTGNIPISTDVSPSRRLVQLCRRSATEMSLSYTPTSDHFIELAIYDERPGGFGPYGLAFYNRVVSALQAAVWCLAARNSIPTADNETEYRRITAEERDTPAPSLGPWRSPCLFSLRARSAATYYKSSRSR